MIKWLFDQKSQSPIRRLESAPCPVNPRHNDEKKTTHAEPTSIIVNGGQGAILEWKKQVIGFKDRIPHLDFGGLDVKF